MTLNSYLKGSRAYIWYFQLFTSDRESTKKIKVEQTISDIDPFLFSHASKTTFFIEEKNVKRSRFEQKYYFFKICVEVSNNICVYWRSMLKISESNLPLIIEGCNGGGGVAQPHIWALKMLIPHILSGTIRKSSSRKNYRIFAPPTNN